MNDGSLDVVLRQDVDLSLNVNTRAEIGPAPWITFEGGGRATGIVLIPSGSTDAVSNGVVAAQFRPCRWRCGGRPVNALMINGELHHGRQTLRSGEYRLYVFTDETVTINLDLPQLTGRTNLPIGPAFAAIRTPRVGVDYREEVTAYTANASYEMKSQAGIFMAVNVMRDENYKDAHFDECLSRDHMVPDDLEKTSCFPAGGGITFVRPLDPLQIQPKRGGFILTTFVGLNDHEQNVLNGESALHHYNFRVISPGSMGELWSQGVLLSF